MPTLEEALNSYEKRTQAYIDKQAISFTKKLESKEDLRDYILALKKSLEDRLAEEVNRVKEVHINNILIRARKRLFEKKQAVLERDVREITRELDLVEAEASDKAEEWRKAREAAKQEEEKFFSEETVKQIKEPRFWVLVLKRIFILHDRDYSEYDLLLKKINPDLAKLPDKSVIIFFKDKLQQLRAAGISVTKEELLEIGTHEREEDDFVMEKIGELGKKRLKGKTVLYRILQEVGKAKNEEINEVVFLGGEKIDSRKYLFKCFVDFLALPVNENQAKQIKELFEETDFTAMSSEEIDYVIERDILPRLEEIVGENREALREKWRERKKETVETAEKPPKLGDIIAFRRNK